MTDPMKGVFQGFDIATAGLNAQMMRTEIVMSNLGNMHSTGNKYNEPYRRKSIVFDQVAAGVRVSRVVEDQVSEFSKRQEPGHADADEDGWVWGSNVDVFQELVDLSIIERGFQANLAAMRSYRTMLQNTLNNMRSS